eukprot:Tbor_TRINITY_DN1145_c0_g1::TRINITY_DN1145_c0_g1_i1::g.15633::m.15633
MSSISAAALRRKQCPFCKEVGSLDNDSVEAQIFCTECGMVVSMNLEESEDTRYYGEEGLSKSTNVTTVPSSEKAGTGRDGTVRAGGHEGVRVIDKNNYSRIPEDIRYFLNNLTKMVQLVEDKVTIPSSYLYNDYIKVDNIRSQEAKYATAAACFSIVVARQYTPIPDHEILLHAPLCVRENGVAKQESSNSNTIEPPYPTPNNRKYPVTSPTTKTAMSFTPFNEKLFITKRDAVVKSLKLGAEVTELRKRYIGDLATVYILRLGWPVSLYWSPVVAIAEAMNKALVEGAEEEEGNSALQQRGAIEQMTPVQSLAVSLMLVQISKKISELFNLRPPESEGKKILLKAISLVTKIDTEKIQDKLGALSKNKIAQAKLAKIGFEAAKAVKEAVDTATTIVRDTRNGQSSTERTVPGRSLAGSKRFHSEI